MNTTVYVLANMLNNHVAEWGVDQKETGPIAFATVEDAERFIESMPAATTGGYEIVSIKMADLLEDAPGYWTQLWTVAEHDDGSLTWHAHPLP